APPARLYSKGPLPWRLLAYLLKISPDVEKIRTVIRKRLLDQPRIAAGEKVLEKMLLALHAGGFVVVDPPPPVGAGASATGTRGVADAPAPTGTRAVADAPAPTGGGADAPIPILRATPTEKLDRLLVFRGVHPL